MRDDAGSGTTRWAADVPAVVEITPALRSA